MEVLPTQNTAEPKDYFEGLKQHYKSDIISGFLVFLIALPLSLGIAKASGFPSIAGIYSAIIGGILVSFISGSIPTIKGPAAGLIVIALGAITELGNGDWAQGYRLALAAIVASGVLQVVFGFFKAGILSSFFPHSVVHGMLAAIGIIIFSKQVHIALGVIPEGKEPIELLEEIPLSLIEMNPEVAIIGSLSLGILFLKPLIKYPIINFMPEPLLVLIFAIPMGIFFDFEYPHDYHLIGLDYHVDPLQLLVSLPRNILSGITFPDFSQIATFTSLKYIIMFALIGSIESLLSAKAIDAIDPHKRASNMNKDLVAVGFGNIVSGFIGGLPMITEIVRSSANINNGGQTRWANFFHGLFMLLFVVLAAGLIQMIPLAALAAMLIYTGYNLSSPKEFIKVYKLGPEQLLYFIVTLVVTLATDLLVGVAAGILLKILISVVFGVDIKSAFRFKPSVMFEPRTIRIRMKDPGMFTNVIAFNRFMKRFSTQKKVVLDFSQAPLIDYTFQENLHELELTYHKNGGALETKGFEKHHYFSAHPMAVRVKIRNPNLKLADDELSIRQKALQSFADQNGYDFDPLRAGSIIKFTLSDFAFSRNCLFGENLITGKIKHTQFLSSDIMLKQQMGFMADNLTTTVVYVNHLDPLILPDFRLEKEEIRNKIMELQGVKDIDFADHPLFSEKYFLVGYNEMLVRKLFTKELIELFEQADDIFMEVKQNTVLLHGKPQLATVKDIQYMLTFMGRFLEIIHSASVVNQ